MEDIKNTDYATVEQLRQDYENTQAEIADADGIMDKIKTMIKSN